MCGVEDFSCTGWETFRILRYALILAALAPAILGYILIRGHKLSYPPGEMTMVAGFAAFVLIAYNGILFKPEPVEGQVFGTSLGYRLLDRARSGGRDRQWSASCARWRPEASRSARRPAPSSSSFPVGWHRMGVISQDVRDSTKPDRNLALELVRVTEAAALAAARWTGRGDKEAADQAAVDAMRLLLDTVPMDGIVVIGEGEKDEAPMLYNGEKIGDGSPPNVDIAVDPLEGTTLCAKGMPSALAVIALSERGTMFDPGPCVYMEKLAGGPDIADLLTPRRATGDVIERVAERKGTETSGVTVMILDRPRHEEQMAKIREVGGRIRLISDGDVSAALFAVSESTGVDLLWGIGGTPEGVISAAAIKCLGGQMLGRLWPRNDAERQAAIDARLRPRRDSRRRPPRLGRRRLLRRHRRDRWRAASGGSLPRARARPRPSRWSRARARAPSAPSRLATTRRSCARSRAAVRLITCGCPRPFDSPSWVPSTAWNAGTTHPGESSPSSAPPATSAAS